MIKPCSFIKKNASVTLYPLCFSIRSSLERFHHRTEQQRGQGVLEQGVAPQSSTPKSAEGDSDKCSSLHCSTPWVFHLQPFLLPASLMGWPVRPWQHTSIQALCQIILGKEPLDPRWLSSTQLQWPGVAVLVLVPAWARPVEAHQWLSVTSTMSITL